jgi:hypothetical protein
MPYLKVAFDCKFADECPWPPYCCHLHACNGMFALPLSE